MKAAREVSRGALELEVAELSDNRQALFLGLLACFTNATRLGRWEEAEDLWQRLNPMGRQWRRTAYRQGYAELWRSNSLFWQGKLQADDLQRSERLVSDSRDRMSIREIHRLRGQWHLSRSEWTKAVSSLEQAVSMAHAVEQTDAQPETQLALAKFHLGQLADPRHIAEMLSQAREVSHVNLAALWLAIGDRKQAQKHALEDYKQAWADGEPYVHRYYLNQTKAILAQLGVPVPDLPPYDPAKREKLEWEDEVRAFIEKLKAKKAAKNDETRMRKPE